jgi:hypothetical protein
VHFLVGVVAAAATVVAAELGRGSAKVDGQSIHSSVTVSGSEVGAGDASMTGCDVKAAVVAL